MPRTALTATQATRAGTALPDPVAGDAANGNTLPNDGRTILIVTNSGESTAPTREEAIPAGETQILGPWPAADYGNSLAFDVAHAELTIQAIRV